MRAVSGIAPLIFHPTPATVQLGVLLSYSSISKDSPLCFATYHHPPRGENSADSLGEPYTQILSTNMREKLRFDLYSAVGLRTQTPNYASQIAPGDKV
jgi:hypothetical protein